MRVKTYWDHTERQRADLTPEQMEELCKIELMEAGVVIPPEPDLEKIKAVEIGKHDIFKITYESDGRYSDTTLPIHFLTAEQAEAAAVVIRDGYTLETEPKSGAKLTKKITNVQVGKTEVSNESDITKHKDLLAANKKKRTRNENLRKDYSQALDKKADTLTKMRRDWREQRDYLAEYKKMQQVWDEYMKTCEGDEIVAMRFLLKAYDIESIKCMVEWLEIGVDVPEEAEANAD